MNIISKVMMTSFTTNIFLSLLKLTVGFISGSTALVADGFHSFSDLVTDIVAILGNKISNKTADEKHPFGHGKYEYLTSIIISLFILTIGFTIIKESFYSKVSSFSILVMIVSFFTMTAKLFLSKYILKKGFEYKSNILISSGKESGTDVISSLVVFISAIFMYFGKYSSIFLYADKIASILVGLLILRIGYNILMENISTLIGEQETEEEYIIKIKEVILKNRKIKTIDNLTLLKFGSYYQLIAEISMAQESTIGEGHKVLDSIEDEIKKCDSRIRYQTIHINPYKEK